MDKKDTVKLSKFLSLILRHKPEIIGLILDENGWANVDELLQKCVANNSMTREILEEIVVTNNKKRLGDHPLWSLVNFFYMNLSRIVDCLKQSVNLYPHRYRLFTKLRIIEDFSFIFACNASGTNPVIVE